VDRHTHWHFALKAFNAVYKHPVFISSSISLHRSAYNISIYMEIEPTDLIFFRQCISASSKNKKKACPIFFLIHTTEMQFHHLTALKKPKSKH